MITTTKTQITQAHDWLDQQLPILYLQHVADKLDVTLLDRLTLHRLDKPVLTAASTAYAKTLQQCASNTMQHNSTKQFTKPPHLTKQQLVDISFDEKDFPALMTPNTKTKPAVPTTTTTHAATSSQTSSTNSSTPITSTTVTTQQPYNYKKELARISNDIKTKLKKQFEDLFAQMEQKLDKLNKLMTQYAAQTTTQDTKLDNFIQRQAVQKTEQDHFNKTITKPLDYLVNNMQHFLKLANPPPFSNYPLPKSGNGQA